MLSNPEKKYSKSKDRQMYEYIADQLVEINEEKLERCRNWIKKYIFNLEELGISLSGKNYLKIFFRRRQRMLSSGRTEISDYKNF